MTNPALDSRARFEAAMREHISKHPEDWPLLDGHDGEDHWAFLAWQAAIASRAGWLPIETAPRDGTPILGYCVHSEDAYYEEEGNRLTDYGARAEGLSHVEDGAHVLVWDDAYECSDGWEMPSCTIPAWWTLAHDAEVTANPTHWQHITPPIAAPSRKETT